MPLQVVPVFVSSTSLDLHPEREAVRNVVLSMKETQFVGMEYFGSLPEDTRRASLDKVDESKVYVGIFAGRYGSGITEAEYRRARERGLPCLIYFKHEASIPDDRREKDPNAAASLEALKAELRSGHTVSTFDTPDALATQVAIGLHNWLFKEYLTPILERAARGEVSSAQAQALLSGVKDMSALSPGLVAQLTARHQLRAPVGDFVGREKEIADLLATLRRGGSAAITGISGMGGIGKTELAYYVAERLRDTYPDAQLVLDMRGTDDTPRDPADALASCIRAFHGLEQRLPDDTAQLTDIYRSTLEGKRTLILLDNASDSTQVRPLLPPPGSALLITSRNIITLPGMQRTILEQLEPSEARELLTGICHRIPADTADQICYLCGYLPLAIRAAGSLLDVTVDLEPSDYAAQLSDERRRLELIGAEGVDINVEASFNLSYARLSPDAARVFRQLAVFPATFDAAAEESVCEDPGHKHLTDLLRRNLVLYNPDTRRYRLHDLARLFTDLRLSEVDRNASQMRHAAHYLKILEECDDLYLQGGEAVKSGLAHFDVELRNIEAGQKWVSMHASGDVNAARLCASYPVAGVYTLSLRQHPREDVRWLESALTAARLINDRAIESVCLGNLGGAYINLGEVHSAIRVFEQQLKIKREIGDRRGEGNALGGLGNAYLALDEVRRAIEFYEQRLVIAREIGDRRGEGRALGNLGTAYTKLGDMKRAIELSEQDLIIAREIGDRYGEGVALGTLGLAYGTLGDMHRAGESFTQGLTIAREIGNRRSEGIALFNISLLLDISGDRGQAIAHAEAALAIFEHIEYPDAKVVRTKLAEWRGEATEGE